MSNELELELHVDDEMVASVSGPRDQAMTEMRRYWAQYGGDGACSVYEVKRVKINIEDVLGLESRSTMLPCGCDAARTAKWIRRHCGCLPLERDLRGDPTDI